MNNITGIMGTAGMAGTAVGGILLEWGGAPIPIGGPHTPIGTHPHGPTLVIWPGLPSIIHTFMVMAETDMDMGGLLSTGVGFKSPSSAGLITRDIPEDHIPGALQDHPFRGRLQDRSTVIEKRRVIFEYCQRTLS
jgi:hypothetical protein